MKRTKEQEHARYLRRREQILAAQKRRILEDPEFRKRRNARNVKYARAWKQRNRDRVNREKRERYRTDAAYRATEQARIAEYHASPLFQNKIILGTDWRSRVIYADAARYAEHRSKERERQRRRRDATRRGGKKAYRPKVSFRIPDHFAKGECRLDVRSRFIWNNRTRDELTAARRYPYEEGGAR